MKNQVALWVYRDDARYEIEFETLTDLYRYYIVAFATEKELTLLTQCRLWDPDERLIPSIFRQCLDDAFIIYLAYM